MAKRVFLQQFRVTLWASRMRIRSKNLAADNPKLSAAYETLAQLGIRAAVACADGKQDQFLSELDKRQEAYSAVMLSQELQDMLDGTHPDVPDWMRKDKR